MFFTCDLYRRVRRECQHLIVIQIRQGRRKLSLLVHVFEVTIAWSTVAIVCGFQTNKRPKKDRTKKYKRWSESVKSGFAFQLCPSHRQSKFSDWFYQFLLHKLLPICRSLKDSEFDRSAWSWLVYPSTKLENPVDLTFKGIFVVRELWIFSYSYQTIRFRLIAEMCAICVRSVNQHCRDERGRYRFRKKKRPISCD